MKPVNKITDLLTYFEYS